MTNPSAPRRDIVLVVDDSPEALGFLTEALEGAGATVLVATSGPMALTIAERITPDVILLDAMMPGMDGFETCRRLKSSGPLTDIPVIFMTGLTDTEHVVHGLDSGGVDYLTKPINLDELRARIRVHLANARTARSARVALDAAGRHLLAVGADGTIRWSTPQAAKLLEGATGRDDGGEGLAAGLKAWLAGGRSPAGPGGAGNGFQLAYLGAIGADEFLFRLTGAEPADRTGALRAAFGLTQREADVLRWIAGGKSNRDIGEILGLSPRTVNKHLEQIYVKLGVENRASAAVKAADALREG
jgi:DNA-binding NarL/FixJ family response regulator